ncbi:MULTISPECIES: flagellin [unclassified Vibrio]|uniref:flagellin n=1 Tax=unclassified Vibrio TaxID=2614977 RepID=UPI001482B016|nr:MULTISPECIES: flagellin [unclassified Vibrio]NNN44320.1 flagellin [Vibrio sp. 1-1(7)]NNN72836.1 flagellin [Vibrio sp. 12-2(3-a)]
MVMSTVKVKPHGIRLAGQEQPPITPIRSANLNSKITPPLSTVQAAPISAYSVSGFLLTQGQQQATSVQIASKSLQTMGKELTGMKRLLTQALNGGPQSGPAKQDELIKSKNTLHQALQQAQFDGKRVVDNQLNLNLDNADIRRFSIPGLNIHRLNEKAEHVRLDFPQGQSVMIQFDGQSDGKRMVSMLDRSVIPMGMRASLSDDGSIVFEAQEGLYHQMQQRVLVTGQGHRFPAGQANAIHLKAEPEGVSELMFDLGSREGIKQSISKINQHLNRVHASLHQAKLFHSQLHTQMQSLQTQTNLASTAQVNDMLAGFIHASEHFTGTFQAMNAQANVRRHSVVALLK